MGYYIETGLPPGKAAWLVKNHDAQIIARTEAREAFKDGKGVICVVDNGPFEAAAYCFDESEIEAFAYPEDYRPKTWLTMDKEKAEELSGFRKRVAREA